MLVWGQKKTGFMPDCQALGFMDIYKKNGIKKKRKRKWFTQLISAHKLQQESNA
jgi:hypothetical protein